MKSIIIISLDRTSVGFNENDTHAWFCHICLHVHRKRYDFAGRRSCKCKFRTETRSLLTQKHALEIDWKYTVLNVIHVI